MEHINLNKLKYSLQAYVASNAFSQVTRGNCHSFSLSQRKKDSSVAGVVYSVTNHSRSQVISLEDIEKKQIIFSN